MRIQPCASLEGKLTADHLVNVVFACQNHQRRLDHAAAQPQHQVKSALLLDVVVRQRAAILELLAREDEALLVRRDACTRQMSSVRRRAEVQMLRGWDGRNCRH